MFSEANLLFVVFSVALLSVSPCVSYALNKQLGEKKGFNQKSFFSFLIPHDNYWKINDLLAENVDSENVAENVEWLWQWLEVEEQKGDQAANQSLLKALRTLIKLGQLNDLSNMCNMDSYSLLVATNRASGGRVHKLASELPESLTRLEQIVYKQSLNHAIECQKVYPRKYEKLFHELDPNQVRKVRLFQDNLLSEFLFARGKLQDGTPKSDIIHTISQFKSLRGEKTAHIAYDTIEELAHDNPDRKYLKLVLEHHNVLLRSDKLKELFVEYLVEPCKYFVSELDQLFVPYNYDLLMLEPEQKFEPKCEQEFKFFLTLSRYNLCKLLLDHDQHQLLENVKAVAYDGGV